MTNQTELKLYAIIRGDLRMTPGKLAAQAGHAYTNSLLTYIESLGTNPQLYERPGNIGTKICLRAKNLGQIYKIRDQLESLDIPHSLITDSGHIMPPMFDGSPIVTAIGIGPVDPDKIRNITRKLQLEK